MTGLEAFTLFHVALSLIGIGAGLIVLAAFFHAKPLGIWNTIFLAATVLTSATGFLFPFHEFMPSHGVGILSLVVLGIAIAALYVGHLDGAWRKTYVIAAMIAEYFNVFVLVAQSFQKVPALNALAPTQSEPPFAIAQLAVLALFVVLTVMAVKKFRGTSLLAKAMRAGR